MDFKSAFCREFHINPSQLQGWAPVNEVTRERWQNGIDRLAEEMYGLTRYPGALRAHVSVMYHEPADKFLERLEHLLGSDKES